MEERHELIHFKDKFPINCFLHKLGSVSKHWHRSSELLWVMEGTVQIIVNDRAYSLKRDDIILINPNDIHELHSEECTMLAIQIKFRNFDMEESEADRLYFDCNSAASTDPSAFDRLKYYVAMLIKEYQAETNTSFYKSKAIAYRILAELMDHFSSERQTQNKSQKYLLRLQSILSYINENYQQGLTISDVAGHIGLTVPYFSAFFEKYMGMNFSTYYNDFRLEKAAAELLTSDESVESVAFNHGFAEVHTFVRLFKKKYQVTPSVYRKQGAKEVPSPRDSLNYLELRQENPSPLIAKYLNRSHAQAGTQENHRQIRFPVDLLNADEVPMKKTFKKFVSVGRAREILYAETQEMLRRAQRDVGYEYIKFHGILSDDMLVCTRKGGKLSYSFVMVDNVIDFLLSIGLKPLIQLSFMPRALAKYPEKTLFDAPFIMSEPRDLSEWTELVDALLAHLFKRYGQEKVETWLFSVWNEPDTTKTMFGFAEDAAFYPFYFETWRTIKKKDKNIAVGTPSMLLSVPECRQWAKNFLLACKKEKCTPDFLNVHYYSDIFPSVDADPKNMTRPSGILSMDEDDMANYILLLRKLLTDTHFDDLPIYLTEWNLTLSHRNLINDTCFLGCYIYKNLLENLDALDSFGYWSLTDMIEEYQPEENLFHGGLGFFTQNGLPKASYHAFALANRLQGNIIARGKGYLVTKSKEKLYIALYNYEHYNKAFSEGKIYDMTLQNRYSCFDEAKPLDFDIPIYNLKSGSHIVKEYYVNRNAGSAFDAWIASGSLPVGTEDLALLQSQAMPKFLQSKQHCINGVLQFKTTLEPLEIRIVEITM